MSDSEKHDPVGAERKLQEAVNELRKIRGESPIDYLPIEQTAVAPEPPICSFCGKGKNQVRRMVAGASAHICNECIVLCHDIVSSGS